MTTRPTVSLAQLDVLEAAAEGNLTSCGQPCGHWRIDGDAVTPSARFLLLRGLIAEGESFEDAEGKKRVRAFVTPAGRELLEDFASREPARKDSDADPS